MSKIPCQHLFGFCLTLFAWSVLSVGAADFQPAALYNLSARAQVKGGEGVVIGGFIITGTQPKTVLLRAIGPSLASSGVPVGACLPDPTLTLVHSKSTIPVETNDNWIDSPRADLIRSLNLQPGSTLDSAIVADLAPGAYTAIVSGKNKATGIALVEAYDLNPQFGGLLANISARAVTESGDNVLIGGFIIGAEGTPAGHLQVLIRAIGPSLAQHGITNFLTDPTLALYDRNGVLLASNDDWRNGPFLDIQRSGLAPTDERESVLLSSLAPGNYTAIVRGKAQPSGIALVEVYDASFLTLP